MCIKLLAAKRKMTVTHLYQQDTARQYYLVHKPDNVQALASQLLSASGRSPYNPGAFALTSGCGLLGVLGSGRGIVAFVTVGTRAMPSS